MIKHTPALGWNSWNTFETHISEDLILTTAAAMKEKGLLAKGYEYVVIDDCWSLKERNENGKLVPDPEKFPHGMKYLSDKLHEMGFKFGMYSCAGVVTCAGYPSSYEHEYTDAATFAEWGVDYLKYDYCFHSKGQPGMLLYKRMGLALANCGRDILFSACSWGADQTYGWIKETGANSFRSTGDIVDNWQSIKKLAQSQLQLLEYNGQGCFNDVDMLVCGMNGKGNVGRGGCTKDEYFTHFALWCMFQSPLMIGCDVRDMDDDTLALLTNPDLLRIDQDEKYCQPFIANQSLTRNKALSPDHPYFYERYNLDTPVLAKYLSNGDIAVMAVNFSDGPSSRWSQSVLLESFGIPYSSGKTLSMRNVVTGEVTVCKNEICSFAVPAHGTQVFICSVVDR